MQPVSTDSIHVTPRQAIHDALQSRMLHNERIYGSLCAGIALLSMVMLLVLRQGGLNVEIYQGGDPTGPMLIALAVVGAYGLALRALAARAIQRHGTVPGLMRAVGILLEMTMCVTMVLVESRGFTWPHFALFGPTSVLLGCLVAGSGLRLSPRLSLLAGVAAGAAWIGLAVYLQSESIASPLPQAFHVLVPQVGQAIGLVGIGVVTALVTRQLRHDVERTALALEERERVWRTFGQHVSPDVARALMTDPEADRSTSRAVTVMFLDVRGYTAFAETRSPHEVVEALNALFEVAVTCIDRQGGIVNKFMGDGLLAAFGAPLTAGSPAEDARRAVDAAQSILRRLNERSGVDAALQVGIGIHSGEAVAGTIGAQARREYTLIGDTVNLAARIEGLTRELRAQLLVSDATWKLLGRSDPVTSQEAAVRGRIEPVRVHVLA